MNATQRRHALGLPAGSIRAAHVIGIVGVVCALLFVQPKSGEVIPWPPYMVYLLFLMIGHFFATHGVVVGPGESHPLYLPGWFVRLLVVGALAGCIGYKLYTDEPGLWSQYERTLDELKNQPWVPIYILSGFLLGVLVRTIFGRGDRPILIQDLQAWLSVLALTGLGIAAVIHLIILPNVEQQYSLPTWEGILGAVVAFYFGERS